MSNELIQQVFTLMQSELKNAQQLTEQGNLIDAEKIYRDMLDQQLNHPAALHGLAELAGKINDQEVREDLLRRAIEQIKEDGDKNTKGLTAIWLSELAEALIIQGKQEDAKACIGESKKIINENLAD